MKGQLLRFVFIKFKNYMENLKKIYIQSLPARIDSLKTQVKDLEKNTAGAAESIRRLAHSLYGSGATYGFPRVSESARKVEVSTDQDLPEKSRELIHVLEDLIIGYEKTPQTLLIIDDDPDIVLVLKMALSRLFDKIDEAETYDKARNLLQKQDYSLILLDLVLPDRDGREILVEMRNSPYMKRIPILVMSALTDFKHKQECFALGADGFIQKPFMPEEVILTVQTTLNRYELSGERPTQDTSETLHERELKEFYQKTHALMQRTRNHATLVKMAVDDLQTLRLHFGRETEDKIVTKAQSVITDHLRESDYLFRHGDGSFSMILPNTNIDDASLIVERMLFYVRESGKKDIQFFMSAGLVDLGDVKTYDEAITIVKTLLNQAQDEGGNRVVLQSRSESLKNKIMLAEDDRLMANIIIHNLKKAGFDVDYFSDGALALEGAEARDYALIITDIKMPVIDGFELLRQVRMLPGKTHTPVLILTSMGNEDDIVRAFDAGADDYLLKPFSPKELIARINRMLRGL